MAKKCTKGKSCSSSCISPGYKCQVELGSFEKEALRQAANFLGSAELAGLRKNVLDEAEAEKKEIRKQIQLRGQDQLADLAVEDFLSGRMFKDEDSSLNPEEVDHRDKMIKILRSTKGGEEPKIVGDLQLNKEDIENVIRTGVELGSGSFGTAYAKGDLVVKVGRVRKKEVEMGIVGSELGIGPKIYATWSKSDLAKDGYAVVAMERVKGLPLHQIDGVRSKVPFSKFPKEIQDKTMLSMIEGSRKMHANGISHGDVNSGNVIITPAGRAVFIDWAFATRGRRENMVDDIGDVSSGVESLAYRQKVMRRENHPRVQRFLNKTKNIYEDPKDSYTQADIEEFYN